MFPGSSAVNVFNLIQSDTILVIVSLFATSNSTFYTVTEENSPVSLRVYNATGGRVATLVQEAKIAPGRYTAVLNGEGLPDGVYLYRLEIGAAVRTGKLLLQR